ncbi:S-adenosyl-L-methionine-dependent methyltransferase [Lineolata rhizophorae]|uniref:S-adenosyl-L-methionine-dependent methyltransferase n=1 Tax=Lineolata rhizophorae TaxID=578093 RepID=A0A6A6P6U3_9PEZI|nr:S-adenosyl-L-methionine-dependent methyltransferase [Lineolata rhizophorae]
MATSEPEVPNPVIEPDTSDTDSAVGSDIHSELISLTSSITDFVYKNGRRYSAYRGAKYVLPNDERESDRNDLLHHIYGIMLDGRLIIAPIGNHLKRILDIGTGTGIWAINVADEYPNAEVIGTDISPIQPSWSPPNLQFEIDNVELDWTYSKIFDLIHFQNLNACISNWPKLLKQCYDNLAPGGYLEAKETDGVTVSDDNSIPENCHLRRWEKECRGACDKLGLDTSIPWRLKDMFKDAGFVDIREQTWKMPFNAWPKDPQLKQLGRYQLVQYLDALQAYALGLLVEVQGWTKEEMEVFLVGLRSDLKNTKFHGYNVFRVVTGRKPKATS